MSTYLGIDGVGEESVIVVVLKEGRQRLVFFPRDLL